MSYQKVKKYPKFNPKNKTFNKTFTKRALPKITQLSQSKKNLPERKKTCPKASLNCEEKFYYC